MSVSAKNRRSSHIKFCPLTVEPVWEQIPKEQRALLYSEGYRHVVDLQQDAVEVLGEILPDGDVRLRSGHLWSDLEEVFGPEEDPQPEALPANVISLCAYRTRKSRNRL